MPFAEKLTFLMNLTSASNKELAAEISVDPSMVSLMRTGKRKLPKNKVLASKMAEFFAHRCGAGYQRQALSEMLGKLAISEDMPEKKLASLIENWITGADELTDAVLDSLNRIRETAPEIQTVPSESADNTPYTRFYYGVEGRKDAIAETFNMLNAMEEPGSFLTVIDDNLEWLLSDYTLSRKLQSSLIDIVSRGFKFVQIMPPLNYINRYTESLEFWLPVYATGNSSVYYYPRLRGNLYRHSMIVVPGVFVEYSSSVGTGSTSDVVMVSTDPKLVAAFEHQFYEHMALCRPALQVHNDYDSALQALDTFFTTEGDIMEYNSFIPLSSLPLSLIDYFISVAEGRQIVSLLEAHRNLIKTFEKNLESHETIQMFYLFDAEEVFTGKAVVKFFADGSLQSVPFTPDKYCEFLQNLLYLLDKYENYYFIPLRKKNLHDFNLLTNDSGISLLVGTGSNDVVIDVRRPEMVTAFQEYIHRKADAVGYRGISKSKAKMQIRALIQKFES